MSDCSAHAFDVPIRSPNNYERNPVTQEKTGQKEGGNDDH